MSTAVLILAAGEQKRWPMTEPPYHKQLLDVGGETIVARIVRQCRSRNTEPLIISHRDWPMNVQVVEPCGATRWTVETLFSTYDLWKKRTVVLLGDVVYSRATMDRIFAPQSEELKVYGNEHEIFALSIVGTEIYHPITGQGGVFFVEITDSLGEAISHAESGVARGGGKLRKFYQAYCDLNMTGNARESRVLRWIDDYTQDVDNAGDYAVLQDKVARGVIDDLPEG
jgi:hypothetical protein